MHANGAEYLAALRAAEGTMTGSMQELILGGFGVHSEGDRIRSKLVALSLIDGVGRVCG